MRVTFEGLCSNCEGDTSCSCKIEDVYLVKFMERGDNSTKERIFLIVFYAGIYQLMTYKVNVTDICE